MAPNGRNAIPAANPEALVSAVLMFRRVARPFRFAVREDEFLPVLSAGAVLHQLIGIGIVVEILRRLGFAVVTVRQRERTEKRPGPAEA